MTFPMIGASGEINLQATISSATATQTGDAILQPHHPITCQGVLRLDEEGVLSCAHTIAPKGNTRTQAALNHSLAILIIELATKL